MRTLGIDYGDARVGIAVGDLSGTLATALCTFEVSGMRDAVKKTASKIAEIECDKIVIGLPKNMDGSESFRAEKTRAFADMLKEQCPLDIVYVDERLSTVEAYTYMNIADYNGKKRRKVVDAISAQIILQSYLDSAKKQ